MKIYIFALFILSFISISCNSHSTQTHRATDQVVILFKNTPSQISAPGLIFSSNATFYNKNNIISFVDSTYKINYFKPYSQKIDTLIIPTFDGVAEVSHLYKVYEQINYLFAAGDTILFEYDSRGRPAVKSLTSEQWTKLYNLPFDIPGFYAKNNYALETMLYSTELIMAYHIAKTRGFENAPAELAQNFKKNYTDLNIVDSMFGNYLDDFEKELIDLESTESIPKMFYSYYSDIIDLKKERRNYYRETRNKSFGNSDSYKDPDYVQLFTDAKLTFLSHQEDMNRYFLPRKYGIDIDNNHDYAGIFDRIASDTKLSSLSRQIALAYYLDKIKEFSTDTEDNGRVEKYLEITGDSSVLHDPEIRRIVVEDPRNDLHLISVSGEELVLGDLLELHKGKVVYVDFWASWCGPCIARMPSAKALREKYKNRNVIFIYLALHDEMDKWKEALIKYELGLNGENYFITNSKRSEFLKQIELETIPYHLIWNNTGELVEIDAPGPDDIKTEELIDKYLN